ncbi:MAG: hypothetical protein N2167_09795 [Flavobacteriales bacterium]|nr:hypothetical protein [Flavobacteriales bacterium]
MKRIIKISMFVLLIGGTLLVLGFVNSTPEKTNCEDITITIKRPDGNEYILEEEVKNIVLLNCNIQKDSSGNQEINIEKIERAIKSNPTIAKCEVYKTVKGALHAEIVQRRPIGRIINAMGESFYLDEKGWMMPAIAGRPARVLVVNGDIFESYSPNPYFLENDSAAVISVLDEVYNILKYTDEHPFWKAQLEQIVVNKDKTFILIPKVGNHEIHFGNIDNMEGKFKKLEIFYQRGMTAEGWKGYNVVDVQYKNQIICRGASVLHKVQNNINNADTEIATNQNTH